MKKKIFNLLNKTIEVYIPSISIMVLLISFVVGIFSRYIIKNPQSWTFELDSIAFFIATMTSVCLVNKTNEHVIFDMFYNNFDEKGKCVCRIISNLLIAIFALLLLPYSIKFIFSMKGLTTQVIKIPRWVPFLTFPLLLLSSVLYSIIRLITDVKSYIDKTYIENYPEVNE